METLIERIENLTIKVTNLKRAVSFYKDILGLKKRDEWSNYATFNVGDVMLGLDPTPRANSAYLCTLRMLMKSTRLSKKKACNFSQNQKINIGAVAQQNSQTRTETDSLSFPIRSEFRAQSYTERQNHMRQ